jgi:cell wall-associated NlpC family hydrolase
MNASLRPARVSARLLARLALVLLVAAGLLGFTSAAAEPAQALVSAGTGARAVHLAASRRGAPYRLGAVGPHRFDCSGLTLWVYGRLGKRLPRTAAQQYAATRHIAASSRRPGDLVFFLTPSGHVHHVGIYAGAGRIWHAPHTGDHVRRARIWTAAVRYGRVR